MPNLVLVGLGGFVGSAARYLVYLIIRSHLSFQFPIATLFVNAVGCFAMGALFAFTEHSTIITPRIGLVLSTGIIGGFTTFSAFGLETVELIRMQQQGLAALNILGNLIIGFAAVVVGRMLVATLF